MEEINETTPDIFADRGWSIALYERVNRVWSKVGLYDEGHGPYEDGAMIFADFLAPTPPRDAVIRASEAPDDVKPSEFEIRMYDEKFLIASISWGKEVIDSCVQDLRERELKTVEVRLVMKVDKDLEITPEYDTTDAQMLIESSHNVVSVEIKEVTSDHLDLPEVP
jgi:hypothetical protein